MINTQVIFAAAVTAGAFLMGFSALIRNVAPDPYPPLPFIAIHALEVLPDGRVRQDRTVTADGTATILAWAAQIEHAETGQQVRGCVGGGTWPYQSGRLAPVFELGEWTGSPGCTVATLPRDVFLQPRVIFRQGDDEKAFVGAVFVVRHDGRIE